MAINNASSSSPSSKESFLFHSAVVRLLFRRKMMLQPFPTSSKFFLSIFSCDGDCAAIIFFALRLRPTSTIKPTYFCHISSVSAYSNSILCKCILKCPPQKYIRKRRKLEEKISFRSITVKKKLILISLIQSEAGSAIDVDGKGRLMENRLEGMDVNVDVKNRSCSGKMAQ